MSVLTRSCDSGHMEMFKRIRWMSGNAPNESVVPSLRLWSCAAAVTIGAIHCAQVAEVNRVFESLIGNGGQLLLAFPLGGHSVTRIAVLADDLTR